MPIRLSIGQDFSHIKWIDWINGKLGVWITFPVNAGTECMTTALAMLRPGKGTNAVLAIFIVGPKWILCLMLY